MKENALKKQRQINLTLPDSLLEAAVEFANIYGYKNIQDLAAEALRDKIYSKPNSKPAPEHIEPYPKEKKKHYIM